ncbi:hypothetical protein N431DRAFT_425181 [Stipitochalara longipes BDJ]|nr:hypothetical protein N431DRAFT_425181 [Stipitochalara longipes BDJ]
MPYGDFDHEELTRILTESFTVLANEVQLLSDRNSILQHKLIFAHEQYQQLADRYAAGDLEISSTLAKLQLPPDVQISGFVPLPQRQQSGSKQQTAVAIRDGRRAAQRLTSLTGRSTGSSGSRSISGASSNLRRTSLSTILEVDFTTQGKKSSLLCPFAQRPPPEHKMVSPNAPPSRGTLPSHSGTQESDRPLTPIDPTPHQSADPICAALYAETMSSPPPSVTGSVPKCPIRYLDQHSPEEVARYFETHKHEIPRSHEICVKRYQRNEADIRKLDAKYGNLVSMIQGLGQKHQPMLPTKEEEDSVEVEQVSNERVENWAKAVSADGVGHEEEEPSALEDDEDRESRFDRPLKEIRVGESPSRPWGIHIPALDPPERPVSPPPAPVSVEHMPKQSGKCPFGHGQPVKVEAAPPQNEENSAGKCTFPHAQKARDSYVVPPQLPQPQPAVQTQPTFIQPAPGGTSKMNSEVLPQMIFTGPVFIGYPMDQAIAFMQQYKGTQ